MDNITSEKSNEYVKEKTYKVDLKLYIWGEDEE